MTGVTIGRLAWPSWNPTSTGTCSRRRNASFGCRNNLLYDVIPGEIHSVEFFAATLTHLLRSFAIRIELVQCGRNSSGLRLSDQSFPLVFDQFGRSAAVVGDD